MKLHCQMGDAVDVEWILDAWDEAHTESPQPFVVSAERTQTRANVDPKRKEKLNIGLNKGKPPAGDARWRARNGVPQLRPFSFRSTSGYRVPRHKIPRGRIGAEQDGKTK